MNIDFILNDKSKKPKERISELVEGIINQSINIDELIEFALKSKDPMKASCIEALEYASKEHPELIDRRAFDFAINSLQEKAPRIKWESAKVIGNTVSLFANDLDKVLHNLLENTEHEGTVVRWSAAFALGEILKLKTSHYEDLLQTFETIIVNEEKNSIKKIYLDAIKKSQK